ncbi:MAG TPA: hypothetical protein VFY29_17490 [Terriglobia bacterium]|nr:hypothetical protein [Terriglobia bacterium]
MDPVPVRWPADSICLSTSSYDLPSLASTVYSRVCRVELSAPGFCLVKIEASVSSQEFRRLMVDLKIAMSAVHEKSTGNMLICLSGLRADQQNSTRLHLYGGPDESLLILGYEPSEVDSSIAVADYASSAADLGMSPKAYMEQHNPIFQSEEELLRPYISGVPCFSPGAFQILVVNNSSAPFDHVAWQGALHQATIPFPDEAKRRIIDSMLIASAPPGSDDVVSPDEMREFMSTSSVRRRTYDRPDLDDDV